MSIRSTGGTGRSFAAQRSVTTLPGGFLRNHSGAHCCSFYYILQIGDEFRYPGSAGTDYLANVADLDGDGNGEFAVPDWAYRNFLPGPWGECCAPLPNKAPMMRPWTCAGVCFSS